MGLLCVCRERDRIALHRLAARPFVVAHEHAAHFLPEAAVGRRVRRITCHVQRVGVGFVNRAMQLGERLRHRVLREVGIRIDGVAFRIEAAEAEAINALRIACAPDVAGAIDPPAPAARELGAVSCSARTRRELNLPSPFASRQIQSPPGGAFGTFATARSRPAIKPDGIAVSPSCCGSKR